MEYQAALLGVRGVHLGAEHVKAVDEVDVGRVGALALLPGLGHEVRDPQLVSGAGHRHAVQEHVSGVKYMEVSYNAKKTKIKKTN